MDALTTLETRSTAETGGTLDTRFEGTMVKDAAIGKEAGTTVAVRIERRLGG